MNKGSLVEVKGLGIGLIEQVARGTLLGSDKKEFIALVKVEGATGWYRLAELTEVGRYFVATLDAKTRKVLDIFFDTDDEREASQETFNLNLRNTDSAIFYGWDVRPEAMTKVFDGKCWVEKSN